MKRGRRIKRVKIGEVKIKERKTISSKWKKKYTKRGGERWRVERKGNKSQRTVRKMENRRKKKANSKKKN